MVVGSDLGVAVARAGCALVADRWPLLRTGVGSAGEDDGRTGTGRRRGGPPTVPAGHHAEPRRRLDPGDRGPDGLQARRLNRPCRPVSWKADQFPSRLPRPLIDHLRGEVEVWPSIGRNRAIPPDPTPPVWLRRQPPVTKLSARVLVGSA